MSGSGVVAARPVIGATAMLANTILIPIMGVAIKELTAQGVGTVEMLAWRAWLTFGLLLPLLFWGGNLRAVLTADKWAHVIHASFTVATMACFYYALRTMPIVTVTAINFSTPIFTLIGARLLYGEQVSPAGWGAMALGFAGTVLVLRPDASGIGTDAAVVLLGSALGAGMNLAVRRMPARSSNYAVLFYFSLGGAVVYGLAAIGNTGLPAADAWPWFWVLAGIALGVHTCTTIAYRVSSSVLIGALDYARILWAALIGALVLEEVPDLVDGLGILLIVASGVIVLKVSTRRIAPAPPQPPAA
ncbi:DMT family transporter [Salipiger sp.]|uniref:DMT family transporter n=1 Tax=Salipiger sp. TaxID=2078585 RepID=UPI003A97ED01